VKRGFGPSRFPRRTAAQPAIACSDIRSAPRSRRERHLLRGAFRYRDPDCNWLRGKWRPTGNASAHLPEYLFQLHHTVIPPRRRQGSPQATLSTLSTSMSKVHIDGTYPWPASSAHRVLQTLQHPAGNTTLDRVSRSSSPRIKITPRPHQQPHPRAAHQLMESQFARAQCSWLSPHPAPPKPYLRDAPADRRFPLC